MSDGTLDDAAQAACRWLNRLAASGGPDLRVNAHRKTANEAQEFADEPCLDEAADVFIALIAAVIHMRHTPADLATAVEAKVAVNRQRSWVRLLDGTWQHAEPSLAAVPSGSEPNPSDEPEEQQR